MYTTKSLSVYKNNYSSSADTISEPPQGLNSGYLVIQDEESTDTCCFGLCYNPAIKDLPFPQNKQISIEYHVDTGEGGDYTKYDKVYLIPVINLPLSSGRYYVIKADSRHQGEAYASSKEEDKVTCFFCCSCIKDVKPRPLDPNDICQQFDFSIQEGCFGYKMLVANSVAPESHPPNFLRRHGWKMTGKSPKNNFTLNEALGMDINLRTHLPNFDFLLSQQSSVPIVVGKWYCPFMFIKEGLVKDQVKNGVFCEMTMEQRWEKIFGHGNNGYDQGKVVAIDVVVPIEVVRIRGEKAMLIEKNDGQGVLWFKAMDGKGGEHQEVGLSKLIMERMMLEQQKGGWVKETNKNNNEVRVMKKVEYDGVLGWRNFGYYVLVESFVLKRNDGSILFTYDFFHTHKGSSKWE